MKIQSQRKSNRLKAIFIAGLLILLGLVVWLYYSPYKNFFIPGKNDSTSEISRDKSAKTETTNLQQKTDVTPNTTSRDVDTTKTTDQIPVSKEVSVQINSLYQKDGAVTYSARVDGEKNGTCSAQFTSQIGKPVIRDNATTDGICSGSLSEAMFDALGKWTLTLRFYSGNKQTNATKDITIQ